MTDLAPHLVAADHASRLGRALLALDGLSVGDAFGGRFFRAPGESRAVPPPVWSYSDDTEMALGLVSVLTRHGRVEQDELAGEFARRYTARPDRGYGMMVRGVLRDIAEGVPWREAAGKLYGGSGSMGNGGAMRVAPLGAYFAHDYGQVVEQAEASAATTHAHPEGRAGAIAVAIAAAWACRASEGEIPKVGGEMLVLAHNLTPPGETRSGLGRALALGRDITVGAAAAVLGNGNKVTAPDTVPFALWCAARFIDDYAEALWAVVSAEGDNDTNGAIVGGIVALANGPACIPESWLLSREPLAS